MEEWSNVVWNRIVCIYVVLYIYEYLKILAYTFFF